MHLENQRFPQVDAVHFFMIDGFATLWKSIPKYFDEKENKIAHQPSSVPTIVPSIPLYPTIVLSSLNRCEWRSGSENRGGIERDPEEAALQLRMELEAVKELLF